MVTLLEGVLVVYSQGVSSNMRGVPGGVDKTLHSLSQKTVDTKTAEQDNKA